MSDRTRVTGRFIAVCVAAALIAVAPATPAPAAPAPAAAGTGATATSVHTYKLYAWNIAGWAMHRASTTNGIVEAVANSIRGQDVDLAALNEVCHNQLNVIRSNLRASGWPVNPDNFVRYVETRSDVCDGHGVGIALISKAPLGTSVRYTLPDDGGANARKLLCAPLLNRLHARFCTTHITTSDAIVDGSSIKKQQLDYVRARLEDFNAAGDTAMIAGDFNAEPDHAVLNSWYASSANTPNNPNNTGAYREIDDADDLRCPGYGEVTYPGAQTSGPCGTGVKIDLIFVRESRLVSYSGDSMPIATACGGPCSDHRIIKGLVTVEVAS